MKIRALVLCLGITLTLVCQSLYAQQNEADAKQLADIRAKAEKGDAKAQLEMGDICVKGKFGVSTNVEEGVKWFRKAAEQGEAWGQYHLASALAAGWGVPPDTMESARWCRKAAEQNLAEAQDMLGGFYRDGYGVPKDEVEAVKWWRKAAEQNLAKAQFNLGNSYYRGGKDQAEAVKWWRKAAEQNFAAAQESLGMCYSAGLLGLTQNYAEAAQWFHKAAEQGEAPSQFNLGVFYFKGRGVAIDEVEAAKWWLLAEAGGFATAKEAVRTLPNSLSEKQMWKARQRARDWLEQRKGNVAPLFIPPLFMAIFEGDLSAVQDNVKSDGRLEISWNDMTPLIAAVTRSKSNALEITRHLVQKGANLHTTVKGQTALSAADFANYLSTDPEDLALVDFLVAESLSPLSQLPGGIGSNTTAIKSPSVTEIRRQIASAIMQKANAHRGDVLMQFHDITIVDAASQSFVVNCDAAIIDESKTQMFEVTSHSRKLLKEPKGVSTHLCLTSKLDDNGGGAVMTELTDKLPRWSFRFSPALVPAIGWAVSVLEGDAAPLLILPQLITSDFIKVPSAEEMKKGAKIKTIKADQIKSLTEKATNK